MTKNYLASKDQVFRILIYKHAFNLNMKGGSTRIEAHEDALEQAKDCDIIYINDNYFISIHESTICMENYIKNDEIVEVEEIAYSAVKSIMGWE